MDARAFAATALLVAVCPAVAVSATHQTKNFVVTAPTPEFAKQVGEAAEYYRHHVAIAWLGKPLPGNWTRPCPISCKVGQIGAGGATTFTFNNNEVFGWNMSIQGNEERILDSVLPHEISHMIFACHFRRPLPRWADEGAATLIEHESERLRQTKILDQVIKTSKRIPLNNLLRIKEYPPNMEDVLTLYAEGYSLADFLVQQKGEQGKQAFLAFLGDALDQGWERAFLSHYGVSDIRTLEETWHEWVYAGSPPIERPDGTLLAGNGGRQTSPATPDETQFRGQSPEVNVAVSDPNPLPRLPRQPRERTVASNLSAPPPQSLTVQPQSPVTDVAASSAESAPTQPISVRPARVTGAPEEKEKSPWSLPWLKRSDAAESPSGGSLGFGNPQREASVSPQSFDFNR